MHEVVLPLPVTDRTGGDVAATAVLLSILCEWQRGWDGGGGGGLKTNTSEKQVSGGGASSFDVPIG